MSLCSVAGNRLLLRFTRTSLLDNTFQIRVACWHFSCVFVCILMVDSPSAGAPVIFHIAMRHVWCIAGDRAAAARALLEASPDESAETMAALESRRAALQAERLQIRKDIRNESRKRKRLLAKAKGLSEDELVSVMIMKAQAKAKVKGKAAALAR